MFSCSVDAGFALVLLFHHGDLEPDCVGVSTRGAYAWDKNTSARLRDKCTRGGVFAGHYGTIVSFLFWCLTYEQRFFYSIQILVKLYESLTRPNVEYTCPIWNLHLMKANKVLHCMAGLISVRVWVLWQLINIQMPFMTRDQAFHASCWRRALCFAQVYLTMVNHLSRYFLWSCNFFSAPALTDIYKLRALIFVFNYYTGTSLFW